MLANALLGLLPLCIVLLAELEILQGEPVERAVFVDADVVGRPRVGLLVLAICGGLLVACARLCARNAHGCRCCRRWSVHWGLKRWTASVLDFSPGGRLRPKPATIAPNRARIRTQSSIDPS